MGALFRSLWQRLFSDLGLQPQTGGRTFQLDEGLVESLQQLAERRQCSQDEIASDLLAYALAQWQADEDNLHRWNTLSPREKDIVALICLSNTNRQIAARLKISPDTVKTHVRNVLYKFGLRSKTELRQSLAGWDFSAWR